MLSILSELKLEISRYFKFSQPLNIPATLLTEDASKDDKSSVSNFLHPSNILSISSTNDVLKYDKSISSSNDAH